MRLVSRLAAVVAIMFVLAAVWQVVPFAQEGDATATLFLNMATDDLWTAQMIETYAGTVLGMGHPVVIFLNVRGVRLQSKTTPQPKAGLSGKTPVDMLKGLIEKGAAVHVCPTCTEQAGMSPKDWIDGVKAAGPETVKIQMDPSTKVMSY